MLIKNKIYSYLTFTKINMYVINSKYSNIFILKIYIKTIDASCPLCIRRIHKSLND